MNKNQNIKEKRSIVLYDGDCGFCNRIVRFILRNEKNKSLFFSSIQSEFTKRLFEENEWPPPNMETFYFINDGVCYERSDAVIQLSGFLRWPLTMIKWFRFIPKKWRDAYYNLVARNRKRLGTYSCHIPDNDIKSRFLN